MMMHRSLSSHSQRYGRAKGMKVKHLVQLVALTVLFTWFVYQVNISYKSKVLSQKEDVSDPELLISEEKGGSFSLGGKTAEFIDKQYVLNAVGSQNMPPDAATNTAEEDGVEDEQLDRRDDGGSSDDDEAKGGAREKEGPEKEGLAVEGHNKDGGDGEDKVSWAEGKTPTNPTPTNNADDNKGIVAGSESSEQQGASKMNLTKQDECARGHLEAGNETKSSGTAETRECSDEPEDGKKLFQNEPEDGKKLLQNGTMITSSSPEKAGAEPQKVSPDGNGQSKESNVTGKTNPRSGDEFKKEEMVAGPISLPQNGADAEAGQAGVGDGAHENS